MKQVDLFFIKKYDTYNWNKSFNNLIITVLWERERERERDRERERERERERQTDRDKRYIFNLLKSNFKSYSVVWWHTSASFMQDKLCHQVT